MPRVCADRAIMWAVIALVAWGIIGVPLLHSQNQYDPQRGPYQQAAQIGGLGLQGVQIDCDPNCAAKHPKGDAYESAIARLFGKTVDEPLALFTAILALATLALALFVGIQVRDARLSSERQLRAYVLFKSGELIVQLDVARPFYRIHYLKVQNTGQTPAYNFQFSIQSTVKYGNEIDRLVYQPPSENPETTDLGSQVDHDLKQPEQFNFLCREDADLLKSRHGTIYVWVVGMYRDGFQRGQRTKFVLAAEWKENNEWPLRSVDMHSTDPFIRESKFKRLLNNRQVGNDEPIIG